MLLVMTLFIITVALVALCVLLLSFNIVFRKNKDFPATEIGQNSEFKKRGLSCAKSQEKILWKKGGGCNSCSCS